MSTRPPQIKMDLVNKNEFQQILPFPRSSDLGRGLPCETGKWSNDTGVASVDGCMDCVLGSTTVSDGAEDLSYCVRPDPEQTRNCTSGRVCVAENVTGSRPRRERRAGMPEKGRTMMKRMKKWETKQGRKRNGNK